MADRELSFNNLKISAAEGLDRQLLLVEGLGGTGAGQLSQQYLYMLHSK